MRTTIKTDLQKQLPLLLCMMFFVLLRLPFHQIPFERDEGEYAYAAQLMSEGDMPYHHSFLLKPPGIIYIYMIAEQLGGGIAMPRYLQTIFLLISGLLLAKTLRNEIQGISGITAACTFYCMLFLKPIQSITANTEVFMLLPLSGFLYLFSKRDNLTIKHWFWTGIFSAFSALIKPVCLPLLFTGGLYLYYLQWKKTKALIKLIKDPAIALAGFILLITIGILPFLLFDGGKSTYECTVDYVIEYQKSIVKYMSLRPNYYVDIISAWPLLCIVPLMLFKIRSVRMTGYVLMLLVAAYTIRNALHGHYFVMLLPFLALFSAWGIEGISMVFYRQAEKKLQAPIIGNIKPFICLIFCFFLLLPSARLFYYTSNQVMLYVFGNFADSEMMAQKVKEHSENKDRIFVAGSEPQIYYLSQRKAITRFNIMYPLSIPTQLSGIYTEQVKKDILRQRPEIIVHALNYMSWTGHPAFMKDFVESFLQNYLNQYYTCQGGTYYDDKGDPQWGENRVFIDGKIKPNLLLYVRKE